MQEGSLAPQGLLDKDTKNSHPPKVMKQFASVQLWAGLGWGGVVGVLPKGTACPEHRSGGRRQRLGGG